MQKCCHSVRQHPFRLHHCASILLFFIFSLMPPVLAQADTVRLQSTQSQYALSPHLEILEDPQDSYRINELIDPSRPQAWYKSTQAIPNIGYSHKTFWFRVRINNQHSEKNHWLLSIDYPMFDYLDIYLVREGEIKKSFHTGDHFPHAYRPIDHRDFVFPITLPSEQDTFIYIRLKSDGALRMPVNLWDEASFIKNNQLNMLALGTYVGVLVVMIFYNLFLYFIVRNKAYLLYVFYLFFLCGAFLSVRGFLFQYLWPTWIAWNEASSIFLVGCTSSFALLFSIHFLESRHQTPRFYYIMFSALVYSLLLSAGAFFIPFAAIIQPTIYGLMVVMLLNLIAGLLSWRAGLAIARLYTLAWFSAIVSYFILMLNYTGYIPSNLFTENAVQIGSAIEVVLLSMAFGHFYTTEREEKSRAQSQLLEKMQDAYKAQTASTAKSEFLTKLSHEIRTPINGMVGIAELLKASSLNKEQLRHVETITTSGNALLNLINDILDLSKIEAKRMELERINFNLHTLVEECMALFQSRELSSSLSFYIRVSPQIPTVLIGDPGRLRQILLNLISNAMKFTRHGSIGIIVNLDRTEDNRAWLTFQVKDTGIGIPRDALQNLFTPFVQANDQVARPFEGTGLGLSICRELVQMMNGNIGVESEPKKGSTFWFTARFDLGRLTDSLPSKENNSDSEIHPLGFPLHALVAEDNEVNRMVIKGMLVRLGATMDFANTGQEAIDLYKENHARYDVILMDCEMPEMDGYEATRQIRTFELFQGLDHVRIVAITAQTALESRDMSMGAGMDEYLTKPLRLEAIRQVLVNYRRGNKPDQGKQGSAMTTAKK